MSRIIMKVFRIRENEPDIMCYATSDIISPGLINADDQIRITIEFSGLRSAG